MSRCSSAPTSSSRRPPRRSMDACGGALVRAIEASRFTGAKSKTLPVLGQAGYRPADAAGRRQGARARCARRRGAGRPGRGRRQRGGPEGRHRRGRSGQGQPVARRPRSRPISRSARSFAATASTSTRPRTSPSRRTRSSSSRSWSPVPADARKAYAALEPTIDSVFFTRDLVSEPANVLYPVEFARRAKAELTKVGVKVEILGEAEMKKLGLNVLLAVGQGSVRESQLLIMSWMNGPKSAGAGRPDRQGRLLRHRRHLAEAGRRHGRHEVGHGRRRRGHGRDAAAGGAQGAGQRDRHLRARREHAGRQRARGRATW